MARGHEVTALASRRGYVGGALYPARQVLDGVTVERVAAAPFGTVRLASKSLWL